MEFNYLLTSCMNIQKQPQQPVWGVIQNISQPDFALLAGDTVYLKKQDWVLLTGKIAANRILARNIEQRNEWYFQHFLANTPSYSTWDDHDYGKNDADKQQAGKEESLKAFQSVWANPSFGTSKTRGVFYTFSWGDVQFLVMDSRYYRDKATESQFGTAQMEWLFAELLVSKATFKIIVSAFDVIARGWSQDCKDIGAFVSQHNISGVLFNAGDIHRNEFKVRNVENWPYPVHQITSSGIAVATCRRPFALIHVNTLLSDPELTVSFYGAQTKSLNYDTIDAALPVSTWSNDPNVSCRDVEKGNRGQEASCTQSIRLSDVSILAE